MVRKRRARRKNNPTNLVAHSKQHAIKPHHTKPYRKRHIALLIIAIAYVLVVTFQLGVIIGASRQEVVQPAPSASTPTNNTIASSLGFSLSYDPTLFIASATAINDDGGGSAVAVGDLAAGKRLNYAQLKPKEQALPSALAATQLSIQISPDDQALASLKAKPENQSKSDAQLAAELLPISPASEFDVAILSVSQETIGDGTQVQKTTYQYTPRFAGGVSYAVAWHGVVDGRPFVVKLAGLVGSSQVPAQYQDVLDSFVLQSDSKVQGVSFNPFQTVYAEDGIDSKYIADLVSPSVVKVYHIVCGELIIVQESYGSSCEGGTGSGFIVSDNGYIATNGHVVVLTAKDIVVGLVTQSPEVLLSYLQSLGLTDDEINAIASDPQKLAAVIAKIYDISDDNVYFKNEEQVTLVSIGSDPLMLTEDQTIDDILNYKDSKTIKRAEVVGYNYNAKDLWVAQSGDPSGFSSSDVALLKVDLENAPALAINTGQITQNEKITVIGFPGDAENALVDNTTLDVSVTNGSISAIKDAAGGNGKLYQSDADASHGNSGGPAITQNGEVFGLLTYRVSGDNQGNAAKSYMRDIADLTELAEDESANLSSQSSTQAAWHRGLVLYSQNHFTAAKAEFAKVKEAYAPHRLVEEYIDNATKQIAAGNDVPLYSPVLIGAAVIGGLVVLAVAIVLVVRHRAKHQMYLSRHTPLAPSAPVQNGPVNPVAPVTPIQPQPILQSPISTPAPPQTLQPTNTIPQQTSPQNFPAPLTPQSSPQPIDQIVRPTVAPAQPVAPPTATSPSTNFPSQPQL